MQYLHEYAVLQDVRQYFIMYFSETEIRKSFTWISAEAEEDMRMYYLVRANGKALPVYLEPLFYFADNRPSLFALYIDAYLPALDYSLDNYICTLFDSDRLLNFIIQYYFHESDEIPTDEDIRKGRLPQFTERLKLPDSMKVYIAYCLEHLGEVQEALTHLIRFFYPRVEKIHMENEDLVVAIAKDMERPEAIKILREYCGEDYSDCEIFGWGISLLNPNMIQCAGIPAVCLLGKKFLTNARQETTFYNVSIDTYTEAVHVYTRRRIIELLRENYQMTIRELGDELLMTVPAIFLHISVLSEEHIIKVTGKRRQAYLFSLNPEYFEYLASLYEDYYKELKHDYRQKAKEIDKKV